MLEKFNPDNRKKHLKDKSFIAKWFIHLMKKNTFQDLSTSPLSQIWKIHCIFRRMEFI